MHNVYTRTNILSFVDNNRKQELILLSFISVIYITLLWEQSKPHALSVQWRNTIYCKYFLIKWATHFLTLIDIVQSQSCVLFLETPWTEATSDFLVLHYLPESVQTYGHWASDAIWSSHLPLPSSLSALNLS